MQKRSLKIVIVVLIIIFLIATLFFIYTLLNQQRTILEKQNTIQQEERAKQIAQQQEQEKQRILSQDQDEDGLTYEEEQRLGTSDLNLDSDSDGLPDSVDSHPAGNGQMIGKVYEYGYPLKYNIWIGKYQPESTWTMKINIQKDWYDYYKEQKRVDSYCEYITSNDKTIQRIANLMKENMEEINEPKSSGLAVAFIHGLPYIEDTYSGFDEYPKYPVETLVDGSGDCEDMSYLTASLVEALNFDAVLFVLPGHMAVGIWSDNGQGTYVEYNGRKYYYLETTGSNWQVGDMPPEYKGVKVQVINC